MSLISLILVLAVVGLIVWVILTYVPMPDPFKKAIIAVAAIGCLLYVLQAFGLLGDVNAIRLH